MKLFFLQRHTTHTTHLHTHNIILHAPTTYTRYTTTTLHIAGLTGAMWVKILAQGTNNNTKILSRNQICNLLISRPMPSHTHTHKYTHTHIRIFIYIYTHKQSKAVTQLLLPNEPALGYLCTMQAFKPCAIKSSWSRASNLQKDSPSLIDRSLGTQSSTITSCC